MKIVILTNLDATIRGFSIITKKRNEFFVSNDLKNFVPCPEWAKDFCLETWNEQYKKVK